MVRSRPLGPRQEITVLALGAGVQSTWLRLHTPHDAAIYADTQQEPRWVYEHLAWLEALAGPPIIRTTAGDLGHALISGGPGGHPIMIPAYTANEAGQNDGIVPRQCTLHYKTMPVDQALRRNILGLRPRFRVPEGTTVTYLFGISMDEAGRAPRVARSVAKHTWARAKFPLIEAGMTRVDCERSLSGSVPHVVRRSSCIFCPFHSDSHWRELRDVESDSFRRAVEVDRLLRSGESACARGLRQKLYLHRSCRPLADVDLDKSDPRQMPMFFLDCLGGCGN